MHRAEHGAYLGYLPREKGQNVRKRQKQCGKHHAHADVEQQQKQDREGQQQDSPGKGDLIYHAEEEKRTPS